MVKWALLAPALILCAVFLLWPLAEVGRLSTVKTNYITTEFVGLRNYARMFTDEAFLRSMLNSVFYILLIVLLGPGGSLLLTLAVMDLPKRMQGVSRFVFYIPLLGAGMIVAQIWAWIFHINGPVNWLIGQEVWWFGQAVTAIPAICIIVASVSIGAQMIVLLAMTSSISPELFDAAKIDGARPWQIKFRIVVPLIAPMIAVQVLMAVINGPQVIEFIIALAPYDYSATMAYNIYHEAFIMSRFGPAAAKAMVLLVILGTMAWAKTRIGRET